MRSHSSILMVATLVALSWSCGGGAPPSAPDQEGIPGLEKVEGGVGFTGETLKLIESELSDYKREILADFVLTLAEYEAAYLQAVGCVEDLGYRVLDARPPSYRGSGSINAMHPGPASPLLDSGLRDCSFTYVTGLSLLWEPIYAPPEDELVAAREALVKCLNGHGAEVPEGLALLEIVLLLRATTGMQDFPVCSKGVEAEFGFDLQ